MKRFFFLILFSLTTVFLFSRNEPAKVRQYNTKTFFDGNMIKTIIELSIQINSRIGLEYCEVEIPFDGLTDVKNINANITDLSGNTLKKLKKKNILIKSDIDSDLFYEDSFVYYFSLKNDEFPFIINYSYEKSQEHFMSIEHWSPYVFSNIEIENANLEVHLPIDTKFHLKLNEFDSVQAIYSNGYQVYKWEGKNYPIIKEETFMPAWKSIIPLVKIIPYDFYFNHAGSFESWEKFGQWQSELIQGLGELPSKEKAEIDEIIKDLDSNLEKIKVLYKRLQDETRYIYISKDVGGYKPHNAHYVSKNKFGDCKALSNYFKAVLDYAGIKSYYSKIFSGEDINPIDLNIPSQQFNHIILYIPLKEDTIWVDCTSDFECGYVGSWIQNRNALVVNGNNSFFKSTPALDKEDVKNTRIIYLKSTLSKYTEINVKNKYKGSWYEKLFYIKNEFDKDLKTEILNKYMIEDQMNTPDQIVFQTSVNPTEIILDYKTLSNTIIQHMGNDLVVNIPEFSFPSLERPKYRDYDIQIDYPIYYYDQITFEKPLNKRITYIPDDQEVKSNYGTYSLKIEETEKQIKINKSFYLKPGNYPLSEYEKLYDFVKESKKLDHKLVITTTN